jgi:CHAT domain-containing protein/tetratricopeptide (TPR) repeat protein
MSRETDERLELRAYLLGKCAVQTEKEKIEEKLMIDKDYFQNLLSQEEELIEDYVDAELDSDELEAFEKHFLIPVERREKVKFALLLKKHFDEEEEIAASKKSEKSAAKKKWEHFKQFILTPIPIAGSILVIAFVLLWIFYPRVSDTQQALASLNKAYAAERPFESRISEFNYAPFNKFRTDEEAKVNLVDQNRAERISLDEVSENPTTTNLHLLARVYLGKKEFDQALQQLEAAQKNSPQNAEILSDIGVAYLEKSKVVAEDDEKLTLVANSIESFDKALALNPNLLPALFNKAIATEIYLPNRAKEAWKEYLKLDQTSDWANEARNRLEILNKRETQNISTAEELESAFLKAYDKRDDEKAFQVVSQNRELINNKYLPQRLSIAFVNEKKKERDKKIELLKYLGSLEKERIGDSFASDLANYYAAVPDEKFFLLKKAQLAVEKGFELCLKDNFNQALEQFELARKLFLKAGNVIEAKTICTHFIAYCYFNLDRQPEAYNLLKQVNDFCKEKDYKWFLLLNLDWLMGSEELLEHKSFTEIENNYKDALRKAEKIGDNYMTQKFLLALLRKSYFLKQETHTLIYLHKLFQFSKQPNLSERQKFRSFDKAIPILALSRFQSFSKEVGLESVALAEPMTDPLFAIGSQINAGIVYMQARDFEAAEAWLKTAIGGVESLEEKSKQITLAKIFLQLGHLEKKRLRFQEASEYYDKSLKILEKLNTPVLLYETKKSRLLAYQQIGNDAEVEKDIYTTLKLAEKNREKILDEQDRNKFFDNEQDIYDVAIEHKLRSNQNEQAYNYAEISNSRSLLDWLLRGANISITNQEVKITFEKSAKPAEIDKIRKKIPPKVQILQYSVLENKVLIWVITKEKFLLASSQINSSELKKEVEDYLESIKKRNPAEDISHRLYNLLVTPVLPYLDKDKEICLIPDKILFHLPFSSLISPEGSYFLEEFSLFYSPSANVFILATEKAKNIINIDNERLLSVGNPAFDTQKFPNLKDLPEAETEARDIAENYRESKILVGKEATKQSFQKIYQNFEIIHFAGHYVIQPNSPLLSKLIMAKNLKDEKSNFLTNIELIGKKLPRTKLIILSACQTGIEKYSEGEGLIGLSRTFLSSGVPLVVASQWKVDSVAAAELMRSFHYFRRQKKLSTNQALRQAQLGLLNARNGSFHSAYFWAAFATFGGYAEF